MTLSTPRRTVDEPRNVLPQNQRRRDLRQRVAAMATAAGFTPAHASLVPERARRLLEEAVEAHQAAVMSREEAHRIVDHVYDREVGELTQEIGGVGVCLLMLAEAAGVSADLAEDNELRRFLSLPQEKLDASRDRKEAAGISSAVHQVCPAPARRCTHDHSALGRATSFRCEPVELVKDIPEAEKPYHGRMKPETAAPKDVLPPTTMRKIDVIARNSAKCLKCGDEIESTHRHDFVSCRCGNIAVDGGKAYLRRVGGLTDYVDTSIVHEIEEEIYDVPVSHPLWHCKVKDVPKARALEFAKKEHSRRDRTLVSLEELSKRSDA